MKRSRTNAIPGFVPAFVVAFFMAALLCGPVWGAATPQPGSINYFEGQASVGGQALTQNSVGTSVLAPGQTLTTQEGRAEILLTPGIFFRVARRSAVQMVSPDLANTVVNLQRGRALVEVAAILPQDNIVINQSGVSIRILKAGLYDFDAEHGVVRVFDGKASLQLNGRTVDINGDHQLVMNGTGHEKTSHFDKGTYQDDFYRWASLRSSYLTEANVDAARRYAGANGYAPEPWYGTDWYWDPWFDAYTFIPGDGVFVDPFGWGFYSPWFALGAPFGYGFHGGYHHFGPGYRPPFAAVGGAYGSGFGAGHAYAYGRGGFNARSFGADGFRSGAGGFRGGGSGGMGAGGFHGGGFSGGGFHGGGFHGGGGGFHGGGGGGHR